MIAIVGILYRDYTHYTLYRSCLLIHRIAIIRSLSFLSINDFEGNTNICVAIKSGSTAINQTEIFVRLIFAIFQIFSKTQTLDEPKISCFFPYIPRSYVKS